MPRSWNSSGLRGPSAPSGQRYTSSVPYSQQMTGRAPASAVTPKYNPSVPYKQQMNPKPRGKA